MNIVTAIPASSKLGTVKNQSQTNSTENKEIADLFNSLFSKSMGTVSENLLNQETTTDETDEALADLLQFLRESNASDAGINPSVIIDTVLNGIELQNNPSIIDLMNMGNKEFSVEDQLTSLLDQLDIQLEDREDVSMVTQLNVILSKLNEVVSNGNSSILAGSDTQSIIRLSKIFTLMQADLDLSFSDLEKLNQLKESLDKLTAKIENILQPSVKVKDKFESLLMQKQSHAQLHSAMTRPMQMVNQEKMMNANGTILGSEGKTIGGDTSGVTNPFLLMSKTEQFVLTLSDKPTINADQFMKAFEGLLNKAKFSNSNGVQKLLVKLNPEHLGNLRIELMQKDGVLVAKIIASTTMAKNLLDSQTKAMKEAFVNQNITVERLEISQTPQNFTQERNLQKDPEQRQQGNQQQQKQESESEEFMNQLEEAKLQTEETEV